MTKRRTIRPLAAGLTALLAVSTMALVGPAGPAGAAAPDEVQNGSFETGDFDGWTPDIQPSSGGGWFVVDTTTGPASNTDLLEPVCGDFQAVTDQSGPGSYALHQELALDADAEHVLTFQVWFQSQAPIAIPDPDTLDHSVGSANQQARVDVLDAAADPFTVEPGDVLEQVWRTEVGGPTEMGWTELEVDLTEHAGSTVRLRFAQVDNNGNFNLGVDCVALDSSVPPPPPPSGTYPPNECSDVPRDVYYTIPFDWAWDTGVTTGVGGTNVCEPLRDVTRAEAVTILWRTMGSPAVATPHDFTDTVAGAYYQPALRWAAAEGHTTGVGGSDATPSTVFDPEGIVDRAEQFTFVWRVMGRPDGPQHPFVDVVPNSFYHPAANWAADTGVTTGYAGSNRFEPHILVDRAQAFTIAYRLFG